MRKIMTLAVACLLFSCVGFVRADDKTEKKTLKGDGLCAKCGLAEKDSCQNAVIVTKDGEKKTYYIVHDDVAKDAHKKLGFCGASKEKPVKVKITGTFKEEDGKLIFTAEKIEKDES
jgi:hypothetical protein